MGMQDNNKSLADHAEEWGRENNMVIPARNTQEWQLFYGQWIEFAFTKRKGV
jgi:hypothetical protein